MAALPATSPEGGRLASPDPFGVRRRYGTSRGLARLLLAHALCLLGGMRPYAVADWSQVRRLVFVCRGNICRSPYAERRALAMGLRASSFGLATSDGAPPPGPAISAAARRGIQMGECRSRRIEDFKIEPGDLLIGMEPGQGIELARRCPGARVTLIGLWSRPKRPHLHDPFYTLADDYFDTCYAIIDSALAAIQERMKRQ